MTGVSITADFEYGALRDALNRLLESTHHLHPVLEDIGVGLEESTRYRFETGQGPDGQGWLSPRYRSGQPLVDRGHLRDSITSMVEGGNTLIVGTNLVYAAIHQFGGKIEAKNARKLAFQVGGHLVMVDEVEIPARPFLGVTAADETMTLDLVEHHITSAWEGYDAS